MEHLVDPFPVKTKMIRTLAAGPKPANTLAFIQCRASGADIEVHGEGTVAWETEFKSQFTIDGFQQSKHDWYLANTVISATGMLRLANTTTDFEFLIALDSVDPFLDVDGVVGFNCRFALGMDGLGLFVQSAGIDAVWYVCAYILCFEPRPELPPSGGLSRGWRYRPSEAATEVHIARQRGSAAAPVSRLRVSTTRDDPEA
jgi:hypothetical protein